MENAGGALADKPIVYLDHNVISELVRDNALFSKFLRIRQQVPVYFPFSAAHIFEVRNIFSSEKITEDEKRSYAQKHLELIRELSEMWFLDFREAIENYTIRPRDPFELYETIQEVSFAEDVMKTFANLFPLESLEQCRSSMDLGDKNLNNLTPDEAKSFINGKLSAAMATARVQATALGTPIDEDLYSKATSIEGLIRLIPRFIQGTENQKTQKILESTMLEIFGYQAVKKDNKRLAAQWDSEHYAYAAGVGCFVSRDRKLLKKLGWTEGQPLKRSLMYFELDEFVGQFHGDDF